MTDLKRNSYALIKIVPFVSMLFFMAGIMLEAISKFDSDKYLRVIGIIPVCIAFFIPYCTKDLKDYSKAVLGVLLIFSICECIAPCRGFFIPYANNVVLYELFDFLSLQETSIINTVFVFAAFISTVFFKKKCKQIVVWTLILLSLGSVLFVLIKDPLWIYRYDYYFSGSYIMLLLSVLISFDFCSKEKGKTK